MRYRVLERHFDNRRGFDWTDHTLPCDLDGFDGALDGYFDAHGWNWDRTVPVGPIPSDGGVAPTAD